MSRPDALARPLVVAFALAFALGCDRNVEPFVPGEQPSQPDLSKIFPPGAERTKEGPMATGSGPPPAPPGRAPTPAAAQEEDAATSADASPIRGRIALAPELAARVVPAATLFLIARGTAGGPPLAVQRIGSPKFPLEFELGPGDRMVASRPFAGPLQLSARLDGDGNATTREPGDLQGTAKSTSQPGDAGVMIVLDEAL
jgi:hypothetical protein